MATTTMTTAAISEALDQIGPKKDSLKKAFDELQSNSSVLSSISLSWSDLESHFDELHNSLTQKFKSLQTLESEEKNQSLSKPDPPEVPECPSTSSNPKPQKRVEPGSNGVSVSGSVLPRTELVAFCEKMDGKGLRKYVSETSKERNRIRTELPEAIRVAPDPAAMVLEAMEGFYRENEENKGDRDLELSSVRRSCVLLLEQLMDVCSDVGSVTREKAKKVAMEWREKRSKDVDENPLESLGFLHLVTAYGLVKEFDMDDIVDCLVIIARYKQALDLCRKVGLGTKIEDLIQKLITKGKHLLAVKFSLEFKQTDKFPPVPLLKTFVEESKSLSKKVCVEGNNSLKSQNEANAKEISALRQVIKVIEDHNLENEYPKGHLERRVEQLEKQKAGKKRPAANLPHPQKKQPVKGNQAQQRHKGNKRARTEAPTFRTPNTGIPSYQQLPVGSAPYVSSSAAPYGMSAVAPPIASYTASSAELYGLAGAPMSYPGNPNAASSHLYSAEPYALVRSTSYGGYGLPPQCHPSYYYQ
ncbi:hypothetical protein UlMin_003783 [Ulmus minor]